MPGIDPRMRQSALQSLSKKPEVEAAPVQFGEMPEKGPDTEESLTEELKMIEKAKLDGSMNTQDYLTNLRSIQNRWDAISSKPYGQTGVELEGSNAGPFTQLPDRR